MPTWIIASIAIVAVLALAAALGMYLTVADQAWHLRHVMQRRPR